MDYFYSPSDNITDEEVIIDGDEFAHLTHVMRKTSGDEIRVVNGLGMAFDVRITLVKKKTAHGVILRQMENHNEPGANITIAAGILKNPSKYDYLVEKVTELGVKKIIPLLTERTIPEHAKIERWQKLALAAMKQCGRSFLPKVTELTRLRELIKTDNQGYIKLIAHEDCNGKKIMPDDFTVPGGKSAIVLIGPEGGFCEEELSIAESAGYEFIHFGERRLRTETAAVVAAAKLIR